MLNLAFLISFYCLHFDNFSKFQNMFSFKFWLANMRCSTSAVFKEKFPAVLSPTNMFSHSEDAKDQGGTICMSLYA